jgi:UPF0271 protein
MLVNADMGESWYDVEVGDDAALMPHLDLCNLACGFHGGDTLTMYRSIELAERHGVAIGAHPSFPDRKNFGRLRMEVADRLFTLLLYQVGALDSMMAAVTGRGLYHLKPHGALYHYANEDDNAARCIVTVMRVLGIARLIGPPTGALRRAAEAAGRTFLAEGFADRAYEPSLHLRSRKKDGGCLHTTSSVREQAELLISGRVRATDGNIYPLSVDTICIHGDHPGAAERARLLCSIIPPR